METPEGAPCPTAFPTSVLLSLDMQLLLCMCSAYPIA